MNLRQFTCVVCHKSFCVEDRPDTFWLSPRCQSCRPTPQPESIIMVKTRVVLREPVFQQAIASKGEVR